MKLFKLWVHQQNFSADELVINPKEFPNAKVGDVLEIHHQDEDNTRLLLQINSIRPDFQQKDTISIEQSVANTFQLRTYWDVDVTKVEPGDVCVDMVELLIKDQYVSRSEMWRFSKALIGSCVYVSKKVSRSMVRAQVSEIWSKGEKLSCGVISEDTRVVFRSSSAKLFLLIQMSREMWDFDCNGDLYFEKAINGFLCELFTKWKDSKANHDVTVVLFSRTLYSAQSIENFKEEEKLSIRKDPYGRSYEDFYKVIASGERRDDWAALLVTLKRHFTQYLASVNCSDRVGNKPAGKNSCSFDGNFLEAINLSMNVFEKHHVDRNFEGTGQTSIIVTPGSGVFEVDREMTSITKQRLLDSGVAIDLVCLAGQPLHTVPLLKFFNKVLGQGDTDLGDDYNIPHWMNHSFYTSLKNKNKSDNFAPRIKVPDVVLNSLSKSPTDGFLTRGMCGHFEDHSKSSDDESQLPDLVNFDEYDAKVFRRQTLQSLHTGSRPGGNRFRRTRSALEIQRIAKSVTRDDITVKRFSSPPRGFSAFDDLDGGTSSALKRREYSGIEFQAKGRLSSSVECTSHGLFVSLSEKGGMDEISDEPKGKKSQRLAVGSAGTNRSEVVPVMPSRRQRTLINPFKPAEIPCYWTCNRHRWSHVFPKGPHGEILHRHYEKLSQIDDDSCVKLEKSRDVEEAALAVVAARKRVISEVAHSLSEEHDLFDEQIVSEGSDETDEDNLSPQEMSPQYHEHFTPVSHASQRSQNATPRRRTLTRVNLYRVRDVVVEHDWTAAVKTSVDWKSLVCPALLPLTSDFRPSKKSLDSDFLEYNYKLFIDEDDYDGGGERKNSDWGKQDSTQDEEMHGPRRSLNAEQMFVELVSQRISKGFQLITPKAKGSPPDKPQSIASIPVKSDEQEYFLSIGRNSHKLCLTPPEISVTKYRHRHQQEIPPINYSYRLWIPQKKTFEPHEVEFQHVELDNYNWNFLDQHICGDSDFDELIESLNYWKARFLLLPFPQRKMTCGGGGGEKTRRKSLDEPHAEGILRFIEALNRVKRHQTQKGSQTSKETLKKLESSPSLPSRRLSRQNDKKVARTPPSDATAIKEGSPGVGSPLISSSRSSSFGAHETVSSEIRSVSLSEQSNLYDESAVNTDGDMLNAQSSLECIAEAMMDPVDGINFLPEIKGLKPLSFLSIEGVAWITQNLDGVKSKEQALQLCQKMIEGGFIQHASGSMKQKFVIGFVIFHISPKSSWTDKKEDKPETLTFTKAHRSAFALDRYEHDLLNRFQSGWFEVAIWSDKTTEEFPAFLAPDQVIESFPMESQTLRRNRSRSSRRTTGHLHTNSDCGCAPAYKMVALDADPHHKSDRPESCMVRYHGNYCHLHAFELEVHWIAATGCVVNDMVNTWSRKALSCGFHLVPVPVSPFPDPVGRNVDPLRLPVFIPINLSNCHAEGSSLFEEFDPSTRPLRMFFFLEAILQRFGFIRDSPYASAHVYSLSLPPVQCRANDYVHTSGIAFVRIPEWNDMQDCFSIDRLCPGSVQMPFKSWGFYWMHNFMLTKRWRSAASGDVEMVNKLMSDLEEFCADKDGNLKEFWESCKEEASRAVEKETERDGRDESIENEVAVVSSLEEKDLLLQESEATEKAITQADRSYIG